MPATTATFDSKRRLVFPDLVAPGDVARIEVEGAGSFRVQVLRPPAPLRPRSRKVRGAVGILSGGRPVTSADVGRMLEEFP
jgi:hypothetical protein